MDSVRYKLRLFCVAVTAIIVSGQLILGGSAVITALTGKAAHAARIISCGMLASPQALLDVNV